MRTWCISSGGDCHDHHLGWAYCYRHYAYKLCRDNEMMARPRISRVVYANGLTNTQLG